MTSIEVLAEALAKHRWRGNFMGCGCGWNWPEPLTYMCGEDERIERAHVAHQASVIAALPDIAIVPTATVELVYPTDQQIDDELKLCGFNPSERYPEHGHDALRTAWREGWDSANRPAGGES